MYKMMIEKLSNSFESQTSVHLQKNLAFFYRNF